LLSSVDLAKDSLQSPVAPQPAKTDKVRPEKSALGSAPSLGARHTQEAPENPLRVRAAGVALEPNDRDVNRATDRGDDELAHAIAQKTRSLLESAGDVGARLDLDLAAHPVRGAHDSHDRVVAANRFRG